MIARDHDLSISRQAALLGISRGSVYYLPKPVSEADLDQQAFGPPRLSNRRSKSFHRSEFTS